MEVGVGVDVEEPLRDLMLAVELEEARLLEVGAKDTAESGWRLASNNSGNSSMGLIPSDEPVSVKTLEKLVTSGKISARIKVTSLIRGILNKKGEGEDKKSCPSRASSPSPFQNLVQNGCKTSKPSNSKPAQNRDKKLCC